MSLCLTLSAHSAYRCLRNALIPLACAPLVACASSRTSREDSYLGDGSFGAPESPFEEDAGTDDAATSEDGGGTLRGEQVRLRAFQGVINLAAAHFCYAADYVADDPLTDADETSQGAAEPSLLPFGDAGLVLFAATTDYATLPAMDRGAITVHAALPPSQATDAGVDAASEDAGSTQDGGMDASVPGDAGAMDAASMDAGPSSDAGSDATLAPCAFETMEALLPLPLPASFLNGADKNDAGADAATDGAAPAPLNPEQRGLVTTASDGDVLTLFGSGLLLDPEELARRADLARAAYLDQHPNDETGADAAARRVRLDLLRVYGPRVLLARGATPENGGFALTLAHLVPDVPASPADKPMPDRGSGPLHLCVTVDAKESEPGDGGVARVDFRNVMRVGTGLDPGANYRFRIFVEADFDALPNSCATTSLKPVAELELDASQFAKDRSYTLVAWGAYAASATCMNAPSGSLIRQGCALPNDGIGARLELLENELPEP